MRRVTLLCGLCCGVLAGCAPGRQQAVETVRENLAAIRARDEGRLRATLHPGGPMFERTAGLIHEIGSRELTFELERCELAGGAGGEARVTFVQTTRAEEAGFRDNRVFGTHILRPDGGQWKIWATAISNVEYLDEGPADGVF